MDQTVTTPAPTPPGTPVSASKVKELWDKGLKATRTEREQAAVNTMFARNKQWVYWNKSTQRLEEVPRHPARVRATVNRVGPDSRRIISKLLRRDLASAFEVLPDAPDDKKMQAARLGEAILAHVYRVQNWAGFREDHANTTWQCGVGIIRVEWDREAGDSLGMDPETGRELFTGDVKLDVLSIHEAVFEPGTKDAEHARWWIAGQALPPADVQEMYGLAQPPPADAKSMDTVHRLIDAGEDTQVPLTMVLTYYQRPSRLDPQGQIVTVVNGAVVASEPWYFRFADRKRLNLAVAVPESIHGAWFGHTPVTDAIPVQAMLNASWSSIIEHLKLAGNARLMVPRGSVDDIEELTDTPGEAFEYDTINGERPRYESPPTMPDWWKSAPGLIAGEMDDILSVHAVSRGEAPTGVESGVALSILSENDDTPTGAFSNALGQCWARAASMVLDLYQSHVRETRSALVKLGDVSIPREWTGADLCGQTTVTVAADSVVPRSRAAQAAWAIQMHDRFPDSIGIAALARIADLPDQDDLIAGVDPDTDRAQRENYQLAAGKARTVDVVDDHANHMNIHRDFIRSTTYEQLPRQIQDLVRQHIMAHELVAAQQAAQQAMAAAATPLAAALPTEQTNVLPASTLAEGSAMQMMLPGGAPVPIPPEAAMSSTEPLPEMPDGDEGNETGEPQ